MTHTTFTIVVAMIALTGLGAAPAVAVEPCGGTPGAGKARLTIEATNLAHDRGRIAFAIYPDDRGSFLAKGAKVAKKKEPAARPVTRACFWLLPGVYAAALYHDEDGNGRLDRSLFAPKEGYGFSNDAPATLGLPSFKAVRFTLPAAGRTIRIRMRYPD